MKKLEAIYHNNDNTTYHINLSDRLYVVKPGDSLRIQLTPFIVQPPKTLVRYVKNKKGQRCGAVYAQKLGNDIWFYWSLCNKKYDKFTEVEAKRIAFEKGGFIFVHPKLIINDTKIPTNVKKELVYMWFKANRYWKIEFSGKEAYELYKDGIWLEQTPIYPFTIPFSYQFNQHCICENNDIVLVGNPIPKFIPDANKFLISKVNHATRYYNYALSEIRRVSKESGKDTSTQT